MSTLFKSLSLEEKLALASIIPIAVVSILFLVVITFGQVIQQQNTLVQHSSSIASILSRNVAASVLFKDEAAARSLLDALHYEVSALHAYVVSSDTNFRVEYDAKDSGRDWQAIIADKGYIAENIGLFSDNLVLKQSIELDAELIGTLVLVFDTQSVRNATSKLILLLIFLMAISSAVAYALVHHLHRSIFGPVQRLKNIMQTVSRENDYTIRVGETDEKDMRDLYIGFDHMLDQIEHRESELDAHRKDLEKQVFERTAEIENINVRRIKWLENMAFFLHHELRNKIVGFRSTLDIIERKAAHIDLEKYLNRARKSTTLMNYLLQSIGNASDLEASLYTELQQELSLSILVNEQVHEYRDSNPAWVFRSDIEDDVVVLGNYQRIVQALDKLITNAVEHSDNGLPIDIKLKSEDEDAVLEVLNTGDALPENREEMFEVFVSSKLNRSENRGLGLFVVKLIVDSHAGEVSAFALEKDQGARFVITIPLHRKPHTDS